MLVSDFHYNLPEELIAQHPIEKRTSSRLLVVDRKTNLYEDKHFYEIINYLNKGDVLVINNTKVLPSRIFGNKVDSNARIELLLLNEKDGLWEVLVRPFRRVKVGTVINFDNLFTGEVKEKLDEGICKIKFTYEGIFINLLERLGTMPLPPYIKEKLIDQSRYQTIYAKPLGSAAAPTAGLHFDDELLKRIKDKGIEIVNITLHIGLGTFKNPSVENVEEHKMHKEYYEISSESAQILNIAKEEGRRIICVGTTSVRTLESVYTKYNKFIETKEETNIFIYPGYKFKVVNSLITNFHLPESTLLMLVSAFYNRENVLKLYEHAVKEKYRFFSFGDAMFII